MVCAVSQTSDFNNSKMACVLCRFVLLLTVVTFEAKAAKNETISIHRIQGSQWVRTFFTFLSFGSRARLTSLRPSLPPFTAGYVEVYGSSLHASSWSAAARRGDGGVSFVEGNSLISLRLALRIVDEQDKITRADIGRDGGVMGSLNGPRREDAIESSDGDMRGRNLLGQPPGSSDPPPPPPPLPPVVLRYAPIFWRY